MTTSRRRLTRYVATQLQSGDTRHVLGSLAAYIVEHRMKGDIEFIVADIARNLALQGHIEADVTTARPLESAMRDEIIEYIKRIENVSDITVTEHVEPAVLGGAIIETPTKRFDASIATKLKRLRNA